MCKYIKKMSKNFNKEQRTAVEHKEGPLLIVAGAGTGKTTVLIGRLEYLITNNLATADEILLLTFTEKAAGEMEDRALTVLPYGYVDLWINTFHGFCERILRDHALDIGLNPDFRLLNETDAWILVKKNLEMFDLDYYRPLGNPNKFIFEILKHFSRLKDEDIKPKDYLAYAEELRANQDGMMSGENATSQLEDELEVSRINELANAYHVYNKLLLDNSYLDFGDLIAYTIKLFKKRPNILAEYQKKFKYMMVDEFQDTNWAQYELIKILAKKRENLMVVGDDDQSIYKFRGASLSNIMQFKDDYPKAKEIVLNKNYRSGQNILDSAYNSISNNNPNRLEVKLGIKKILESKVEGKGDVTHCVFETEDEEVSWVVSKMLEIYQKEAEVKWSDFAILLRANSAADKYIKELARKNIPNVFVALRGLYYKPIILDCIAYLKLLDNYHESSALYRVLNMDVFKVGYQDIVSINKFAKRKVWSLYEALKNINAVSDVSPESVVNINNLMQLIDKHSKLVQDQKPSKIFVQFVWEAGLNKKDPDKYQDYYSYLNQFYQKIKKFEGTMEDARLKDFTEQMDMEMEAGETGGLRLEYEDAEVVKVMTVHASKGLEFDYVFIPDLVDKRFPTISRKEKISIPEKIVKEVLPDSKNVHIEEERRLFYVAMTRAKKGLFLLSAKDYGGAREKKESIFLGEIDINKQSFCIEKQEKETTNDLLDDINEIKFGDKQKLEARKYKMPVRFSFSQIEAFANCPLQYKFNFLLKIPVPQKSVFIFGRVMHNVLKVFLERTILISGQQGLFDTAENQEIEKPSYEDLKQIFKEYWQDDGFDTKEEREDYHKKGLGIIKMFYEDLEKNGWPEILMLEKAFSLKINNYIFKGAIDRIDKLEDGTVEIMDYKTGNPKEKLDYRNKRQLLLYKIAVEEVFGLKVSKLSFYYLENCQKLSFEAKDKDLDKLKQDILKTIEEIKKGEFLPNPGPLCQYCDFRTICEFRK